MWKFWGDIAWSTGCRVYGVGASRTSDEAEQEVREAGMQTKKLEGAWRAPWPYRQLYFPSGPRHALGVLTVHRYPSDDASDISELLFKAQGRGTIFFSPF